MVYTYIVSDIFIIVYYQYILAEIVFMKLNHVFDLNDSQSTFHITINGLSIRKLQPSYYKDKFMELKSLLDSLQEGEKVVKKVGGVFAFKVKDGPDGKEATWVVDVKNGKGSVTNDPGMYLNLVVKLCRFFCYCCFHHFNTPKSMQL